MNTFSARPRRGATTCCMALHAPAAPAPRGALPLLVLLRPLDVHSPRLVAAGGLRACVRGSGAPLAAHQAAKREEAPPMTAVVLYIL